MIRILCVFVSFTQIFLLESRIQCKNSAQSLLHGLQTAPVYLKIQFQCPKYRYAKYKYDLINPSWWFTVSLNILNVCFVMNLK